MNHESVSYNGDNSGKSRRSEHVIDLLKENVPTKNTKEIIIASMAFEILTP
jgi:hypothetical protein